MVYVTADLVDVLLEHARAAEPTPVTVPLGVTPAAAFDTADLPDNAAVFTHLYVPEAGRSVSAVFGVDLATPAGRTPGVFVSHPDGRLRVDRSDTLREVVLVAVPPWDRASIAAFGRDGRRRDLDLVAEAPPEEAPP